MRSQGQMMKNKKTLSSSQLAFVLSGVFHAIAGLFLFLSTDISLDRPTKKEEKVSEVVLVDAEEVAEAMREQAAMIKGQIVEQDKQLNNEIDKNARFMSKFNQRVVEETQAELHGKFKNTADKGGESSPKQEAGRPEEMSEEKKTDVSEKQKAEKEVITSDEGFVASGKKPSLKDLTPSFRPSAPRVDSETLASGGGEGSSATDDHLKNVKTGMQTMLSTREFVYYSYYNRIKDKLRQYWQPKIKEKMERIMRQGRTIASTGDKVTKIVIILDDKGVLRKVQVLGPSGVTDLDDAAVEAFRAAAPFPNPPDGIVEADGTIKIRWDFILEANAGGLFDALNSGVKTM